MSFLRNIERETSIFIDVLYNTILGIKNISLGMVKGHFAYVNYVPGPVTNKDGIEKKEEEEQEREEEEEEEETTENPSSKSCYSKSHRDVGG